MKVLTGIKASGKPHLGNYLGAIRPALDLVKKEHTGYFFIADYHGLTSLPESKAFKDSVEEVARTWLSCGLDSQKHYFYRQSDLPEIFELSWILSCFTPKGFMNRAHAYKALVHESKSDDKVSMGLYSYPILMASDILLFSSDQVPVGEDQLQHIEFARDIAKKFNNKYGELLKVPQAVKQSRKLILGTDGRKMSKSYNNTICMFDDPEKLRKSIMKIKTDSLGMNEPKSIEQCLLFHLYQEFSNEQEIKTLKHKYQEGVGWGEVKEILFLKIESFFKSSYDKYLYYKNKPQEVEEILQEGSRKASKEALILLQDIRRVIGHTIL